MKFWVYIHISFSLTPFSPFSPLSQTTLCSVATETKARITCLAKNSNSTRLQGIWSYLLHFLAIRCVYERRKKCMSDDTHTVHNTNSPFPPIWKDSKVYVQHKIVEQGALLWELINARKAYIYVAGWAGDIIFPSFLLSPSNFLFLVHPHLGTPNECRLMWGKRFWKSSPTARTSTRLRQRTSCSPWSARVGTRLRHGREGCLICLCGCCLSLCWYFRGVFNCVVVHNSCVFWKKSACLSIWKDQKLNFMKTH